MTSLRKKLKNFRIENMASNSVNPVNICIKTMTGEIIHLSVDPYSTLKDVSRKLSSDFPQFPSYETSVLRLDNVDNDIEERPFEENEILYVLVQEFFSEQMLNGRPMIIVCHPLLEISFAISHHISKRNNHISYNLYCMEGNDPFPIHTSNKLDKGIFLTQLLAEEIPTIRLLTPDERYHLHEGIRSRIRVYYEKQKIVPVFFFSPQEIYKCECGSNVSHLSIMSHDMTKKHKSYMRGNIE